MQLIEQAAHGVAEVGQETAAAAAGAGDDVDARHIVAQGQARLADRLVDRVGMAGRLDFAAQPGDQPQVVVGERQPAQGPRSLRLERARQA